MKITIPLIILILTVPTLVLGVIAVGSSSSYTFYVENCTSPQLNQVLNCSPATVRFECDIEPSAFIDDVSFRVDGADYTTTQNISRPQQFYLTYNKPQEVVTNNNPLTLSREQITDVDLQKLNAYEIVEINRSCTTCPASYSTTTIQACNISNQEIIQYISNNESCAPSYNLTQSCNYCSPNIFANYSTCDQNGTRTVNYFDLNYTTCCLTTGLSEDCIINTPTYNPANESCNYYTNQFTCTLDNTPVIDNKMNVNCELPTDEETCCVVNIYQGTNFTSLLQTSPEYKSTSNFFLLPKDQETRTCFTPNQRLLNAYYTDKEIRPNTAYKLEIKCTSQNTTLLSQYQITPEYHTYDWLTHRIEWFGNSPITITLTIIVIIAIIAILVIIAKKIL